MKFPVLHAEPDCSPARATRWRHGGCSLALLCSLARQKRYLAAVWLARFFAVWLGIWLQSGCFWLFLAPFLPFLPFWLAVWLRCFCSLALFCCSLAFFSEPDCKSGARLQNNGARLQVREPDCKKKEPDCKKTAVRLFAVRLHNSSCRVDSSHIVVLGLLGGARRGAVRARFYPRTGRFVFPYGYVGPLNLCFNI